MDGQACFGSLGTLQCVFKVALSHPPMKTKAKKSVRSPTRHPMAESNSLKRPKVSGHPAQSMSDPDRRFDDIAGPDLLQASPNRLRRPKNLMKC